MFPPAETFFPARPSLTSLRGAARHCTACPLFRNATQTVFGEGPRRARLVLIGEQPGDHEDLEGRPFVGPAGSFLEAALARAGLPRGELYLTNAVKHFKFEVRGKRRIHQKPDAGEVEACRPWLGAELALLRPEMIVCLGATAVRAIFGPAARVTRDRGRPLATPYAPWTLMTYHPSALLRMPTGPGRDRAHVDFAEDLQRVARRYRALAPRAATA